MRKRPIGTIVSKSPDNTRNSPPPRFCRSERDSISPTLVRTPSQAASIGPAPIVAEEATLFQNHPLGCPLSMEHSDATPDYTFGMQAWQNVEDLSTKPMAFIEMRRYFHPAVISSSHAAS